MCLTLLFIKLKSQSILNVCSAALAHSILQEKLHTFGILGCALCVVGSITIALHAPQERDIDSVREVWDLATEPGIDYLPSFTLFLFHELDGFIIVHYGFPCSQLFFHMRL
jgi:hypothetical protein